LAALPFGPIKTLPKIRLSSAARWERGYFRTQVRKETNMATGTVKWFNAQKGYGFIQPSDGGRDVFVHISAVERAGLSSLNEGQKINYELVTEKGKTSAANLTVA
jgi:CspA family cold shock protein